MPNDNRTSTDANQADAQNGTGNDETAFNPIVPQDKTGRTDTIIGRLTLGDFGTGLVPPAVLFLALTDYAAAPVGWSGLICIVLGLALGALCFAVLLTTSVFALVGPPTTFAAEGSVG